MIYWWLEVHDCIGSRHKSTDSSMILYPLWGHQLVVEDRSFTCSALYILENMVYMTLRGNTELCTYVMAQILCRGIKIPTHPEC